MANHRYIIRKQRIAPGYLTRVEILEERELFTDVQLELTELVISFFPLAPGEQLIIHNAGEE